MGGPGMMKIRDYHPNDEKQILNLFEATFSKKLSEDFWRWRFENNPAGKHMIKLMWDGEILAGHYAVSPVHLNVEGQTVLTALSMTTMTHPDYAGKGIFAALAKELYDDCFNKHNVSAVWGFPNSNSHYGFIKNLGWYDLEQIPLFTAGSGSIAKVNAEKIKVIERFTNEHHDTVTALTENFSVKTERSKEYLEWRYNNNPSNKYSIFEFAENDMRYFAVAKIYKGPGGNEIDIVELAFPAEFDLLLQLMNRILQHYGGNEQYKLNMWLPLRDPKHILLEKMGFSNTAPVTYAGIRILGNNFSQLQNSKDWYYSMGDSDIY
jgi:hypothetical protein